MQNRKLVTVSYTSIDSPGGVPKFNRNIHNVFKDLYECKHYCWDDFPFKEKYFTEWEAAKTLNEYLIKAKLIDTNDIVIADGFWAGGLEHMKYAISHSHGIWSHLTDADVKMKKFPDMPLLHTNQVRFRKKWTSLNKQLTSVSKFISDQMKKQWGFNSITINNSVDDGFKRDDNFDKPKNKIILHGVNDKKNKNKGWDFIYHLKEELSDYEILSLDEVQSKYNLSKQQAISAADFVVHPSGFEGNSMFLLECLACVTPIIGYDVGYLYELSEKKIDIGCIIKLKDRSEESMLDACKKFISFDENKKNQIKNNILSLQQDISFDTFSKNWKEYIQCLTQD